MFLKLALTSIGIQTKKTNYSHIMPTSLNLNLNGVCTKIKTMVVHLFQYSLSLICCR